MAMLFDITAATNIAEIDHETRKGEAAFTVTNQTGQLIRGRAIANAIDPVAQLWLTIEDDAERSFQPAGAQPYTVKIKVPVDAPGGDYRFQLDMIEVSNPDETYTKGPAVKFVVPAPIEERKKVPWRIIIAALVAVLVIVAIIIFVATRPRERVPNWEAIPVEAGRIRLVAPIFDARLDTIVTRFQELYPAIEVEQLRFPSADYETRLAIMIAAGEELGVVWANSKVFSRLPETDLLNFEPYFELVEWTPSVVREGSSGDINAVGNWTAMSNLCCPAGAAALAMYLAYEYDGVR